MKRLVFVLLLVLCLTGCGWEEQIAGEVVKVGLEPNSHSYLLIRTEDGRESTVTFDDMTAVISFVEDTQEILAGDGVRIALSKVKKHGQSYALSVFVEKRLFPDGAVLKDGTVLDIQDYGSYRIYQLKNGTALLDVREPTGPEHAYIGGTNFEDLSEVSQESILTYFEEVGLHYDVQEELEKAYRRYQEQGEAFRCHLLSQDITLTAANERIVAFQTAVVLPSDRFHSIQYREGTVFDRETGELIDNSALFNRDMEDVLPELLDRNGIEESLKKEMLAAFRPEYVLVFDEVLEIEFPYGTLDSQETGGTILGYEIEDVEDLLQPWAVMKQNPDA